MRTNAILIRIFSFKIEAFALYAIRRLELFAENDFSQVTIEKHFGTGQDLMLT